MSQDASSSANGTSPSGNASAASANARQSQNLDGNSDASLQSPPALVAITHRWLGLSLGLLIVFLLLWVLPHWQISHLNLSGKDRLLTENTLRDTWSKILGTLFFLFAAYFTWRYVEALGKTVAAAERTVAAAEKSAAIGQERHITERFVRVMELLGDEKLEVRLGGIYALERIASDSPKDQSAVTEVLATYVREHAPWNQSMAQSQRIRADVQAILTVLGRRTWADSEEQSLDLHETSLSTAYLPFASLQRAYLYEANLRGAMLYRANLQGSWLWKAQLHNAVLEGAHLEGADLTAAEGLTWDQLEKAHIDKTTKLPDYLRASIPDNAFEPKPEIEDVEVPALDGFQADILKLPTKISS